LVKIHVGRIDPQQDKVTLDIIKEYGLGRVRVVLLESQKLVPDGFGVRVSVKDAPFCLLAEEHGTRNGREAPDTAGFPQKDAVGSPVWLLQLKKNGLHLLRGRQEAGNDLIGKEGDNALKAAAGADPGIKTGAPAKGAEVFLLEFRQVLTKLKIRVQALLQFPKLQVGEVPAGLFDGLETGPLLPLVFAHMV